MFDKQTDSGVSPVIGVILMVAVTVALVALVTVVVFDIGGDVSDSPDATGGFLELLVGYGLYNPVGLLIIFAVTLLIANITLAFLQLPSIVYIAVNLAIGTGFLAFNFIPFWAGFIFLAVITLFLILSIRGSRI